MHMNITKTGDNNIIFNSGQKTSVGKELFRKGSYFFVSASEVVRHFCVSFKNIKEKVLLPQDCVCKERRNINADYPYSSPILPASLYRLKIDLFYYTNSRPLCQDVCYK